MPIKAPAIDFSQIGAVTTEAVNKMRKGLYEAMDFDAKKLAEKRTEFMSNLELGQLNQTIRGRAQEVTSNTVNDFLDKWSGIYAEKGGRLSHTDLVKMRQHQINVEQAIEVTNRGVEEFAAAAEAIRGKDGGRYDRETWEENKKIYLEDGKEPEDGFLTIRSANFKSVLEGYSEPVSQANVDRDVRRRQVGEGEDRRILTEEYSIYSWASDEKRQRIILDFMHSAEENTLGVMKDYREEFEGKPEEAERLHAEANDLGMNYLEYYAITNPEYIEKTLPNRRRAADSDVASPDTRGAARDTSVDLSTVPQRSMTVDGTRYENVLDLTTRNEKLKLQIDSAKNIKTGMDETMEGSVDITLHNYDPKTGTLVVKADRKGYQQQKVEEGMPLFKVNSRSSGAPITQQEFTEGEARRYIESEDYKEGEVEIVPAYTTDRPTRMDVYYELDINDYEFLREEYNLPKPQRRSLNDL